MKRSWSNGTNLPYALLNPTAATDHNQSFAFVIGIKSGEHKKLGITILDHEHVFKDVASFHANFLFYRLTEEQTA